MSIFEKLLLEIPSPQRCPSPSDIPLICRICLIKRSRLKPIQPISAYVDKYNSQTTQDLHDKIKMCSGIEIDRNDESLPSNICERCVHLLLIAHYFKLLCTTSDKILRRIIDKNNVFPLVEEPAFIKEESNDNIEDESEMIYSDETEIHVDNIFPDPDKAESVFNETCHICLLKFPNKSSLSDHFNVHINDLLKDKSENSLFLSEDEKIELKLPSLKVKDLKRIQRTKSVNEKGENEKKIKCRKSIDNRNLAEEGKICLRKKKDLLQKSNNDMKINDDIGGYYECLICNTVFDLKENLIKHMYCHNNSGKFKCYGCEGTFDKYSERTKHEKYSCLNMPPGAKYECSKCKTKCDSRFKFDSHSKFGCEYKPISKPETKTIELGPLLKCQQCEMTTMSRSNLRNHILNCHTEEKPYICEICGKGYAMVSVLNGHRKQAHTTEKRFKCSYCPYAARQQSSLNVHTRRHTLEYRYSCEVCGAKFKQNTGYHIHMRRHHKEKEFQCEICKKMFSENASLKQHVSAVHLGLKPHGCKECGAAYSRKRTLKRHLLKVHNITMAPNTLYGKVATITTNDSDERGLLLTTDS